MKIVKFKVKRRILNMDTEGLYGDIMLEDVGEKDVDYTIHEGLEKSIDEYFRGSRNYGEKEAELIKDRNLILTRFLCLQGWVLELQGDISLHIYFDKERFIVSSEKDPKIFGYRDYQLNEVKTALDDIYNNFNKKVDDILNQLWV